MAKSLVMILLGLLLIIALVRVQQLDSQWQTAYDVQTEQLTKAEAGQEAEFYRGTYAACLVIMGRRLGPAGTQVCNEFAASGRTNGAYAMPWKDYDSDYKLSPERGYPQEQQEAPSNNRGDGNGA